MVETAVSPEALAKFTLLGSPADHPLAFKGFV